MGIKGTARTFLGSRKHELKHFREQVVLLMGNKGSKEKKIKGSWEHVPPGRGS